LGFIENFAQDQGFEVKASRAWSHIVDDWTASSGAAPPDAFSSHKTAADRISWVLAATRRKGQDVASCPLRIYQRPTTAKGRKVEITDQPTFAVWRDPNPWETRSEFWQKCSMYLDLFGENFWELVGSGPENLQEVYSWKPWEMSPLPDKRNFISGFVMDPGEQGKKVEFAPEEMLWLRHPNPFDLYRGLSRLHALGQGLNMHDFALRYAVNTFKNQARPSVIVKSEAGMQESMRDRFYTRFTERNTGPDAANGVMLIDGGDSMDIEVLKHSMQDLEFSELLKWTRQEIFTAFGVPPAVVGVFDQQEVRANTADQLEWYWDTTVIPLQRQIAMSITEYLLMPLNDRFEAEFDTSEVKTLQENETEKAALMAQRFGMGAATPNDIIEAFGGDPIKAPAMDSYYMPFNVTMVASKDKATQAALEAEGAAERAAPEQPEGGQPGEPEPGADAGEQDEEGIELGG